MRTLEATGKSIDEAIFNGLRELQISIDEVEIDIIQQETKGVFGIGAKPAIVRLIEREPEKIVIPDYVANKDMPRERRERRDNRERRDRREREPRPPRTPRAEVIDKILNEDLKDEMLDVVKPDLVLCGARGLSSIKYALLGSISTFLLRNTDCDILVVK